MSDRARLLSRQDKHVGIMKKIRDESGNTYYGVDEDLRERLQAKLMRAVLSFKTDK